MTDIDAQKEYEEIIRQEAEVAKRKEKFRIKRINFLRAQAAEIMTELDGLSGCPPTIRECLVDKNGSFNAARVFRKMKG